MQYTDTGAALIGGYRMKIFQNFFKKRHLS